MARHAYKAEKRRKETARLKKQEEKRQRRFNAKTRKEDGELDTEELEGQGMEGAVSETDSDGEAKKEGVGEEA